MGLHYLTFMGRNLIINTKKLTLVQIMNNACLSSKTIMNNVGVFNDSVVINRNLGE